ncbi:MAG: phosphomannomutase [Gammaproteobacteria bacterium]|nr:phosphomannomutase [Gammaproteobacteria bacterium]
MTSQTVLISELMSVSGVGFGTSGARGKVEDMTDRVCYAYARAFLQHLSEIGDIQPGTAIALAGDFRPSSSRIMAAVAAAIEDANYKLVNCGTIASPAVASFGIEHGLPSIMVTGSHIPDDRNGIKFNKSSGEILKPDEEGIRKQHVALPTAKFTEAGDFINAYDLPEVDERAYSEYIKRYTDFFGSDCLKGLKIGVYEHSSVLRQALSDVITKLGAEVIKLGFSEKFIPVDTEAVREEDVKLASQWSQEYQFDAIVSADGDGDRPLISDEQGEWLRGDIVGIIAADYLKANIIATPVSCNSAVEKCGRFDEVKRTRIGSPYVIAAMQEAQEQYGAKIIIGYEANGGFLTQTMIEMEGRKLSALPTRDAILPMLAIIAASKQAGCTISALQKSLPARYTYSDRLKEFPTEISQARLAEFIDSDTATALVMVNQFLGEDFSPAMQLDSTDGVRFTLENEEVVHIRPSGNAPELRCYTESDTTDRAKALNDRAMKRIMAWRDLPQA